MTAEAPIEGICEKNNSVRGVIEELIILILRYHERYN